MDDATGIFDLIRRIGGAHRQAADDWVRHRGLTTEQGFTLGYLAEHPGTIQRDIARMSRTTPAAVSSLLQGLERRGLVERRAENNDDRAKRVYATPAAVDLVAGFDEAIADAESGLLAALSAPQRAQLRELLAAVVGQLPAGHR